MLGQFGGETSLQFSGALAPGLADTDTETRVVHHVHPAIPCQDSSGSSHGSGKEVSKMLTTRSYKTGGQNVRSLTYILKIFNVF